LKSEKEINNMVELLKKELDKRDWKTNEEPGCILLYYVQALMWTLNKYDSLGIKEEKKKGNDNNI
jgi:hypothetical protein